MPRTSGALLFFLGGFLSADLRAAGRSLRRSFSSGSSRTERTERTSVSSSSIRMIWFVGGTCAMVGAASGAGAGGLGREEDAWTSVGAMDSGVSSGRALGGADAASGRAWTGASAEAVFGAGIGKIVAHLGHLIFLPDVAGTEVLSAAAHFGQAKVMTDMAWLSQWVQAILQRNLQSLGDFGSFPGDSLAASNA